MTRYYFDFHEADTSLVDDMGLELVDIAAAKQEALRGLLERAAEIHDCGLNPYLTLDARTASGKAFSVSLSITVETPEEPSAESGTVPAEDLSLELQPLSGGNTVPESQLDAAVYAYIKARKGTSHPISTLQALKAIRLSVPTLQNTDAEIIDRVAHLAVQAAIPLHFEK